MKHILSSIIVCLTAVTSLAAQDDERKQYLPEAGDWSIGLDIKPVFNYVSGLFNDSPTGLDLGGGQPSIFRPDWDSLSSSEKEALRDDYDDFLKYYPTVSIMGKYMLRDNLAIKANVGVLFDSDKQGSYSPDQQAQIVDPLSESKVANMQAEKTFGLSALAGVEYRIGRKRIQGVFGGGLLFGAAGHTRTYKYGNGMTPINQWPEGSISGAKEGYRKLKEFSETPNFYAGLYGSAGVECFVAPKVALGAEVSLCVGYQISPQKYEISEGYNPNTEVIEKHTELVEPLTASFLLSTRSLGGSLYLAFYF